MEGRNCDICCCSSNKGSVALAVKTADAKLPFKSAAKTVPVMLGFISYAII